MFSETSFLKNDANIRQSGNRKVDQDTLSHFLYNLAITNPYLMYYDYLILL